MTATSFTESVVEEAALAWLESVGWAVVHGPNIAPDTPGAERGDYGQVVLAQRLRDALARLNPALPAAALEDAFRKLMRAEGAEMVARNRAAHRLLVDGVAVEYRAAEGDIRGAQVRVIDFDEPANNDWLAVNQVTVIENKHNRRPDVVLFVNGLPLAILELKNAADEDATIWTAFQQIQTYKAEIPSLFTTNELLVVSDGVNARVGTLTAGREWFKPWRTVSGQQLADPHIPELQVVLEGLLDKQRFLDLVRDFTVFEDEGGGRLAKKMAGYHQFHAVQAAVDETLRAAELRQGLRLVTEEPGRYEAGTKPGGEPGDRRIGVVWHTQGSGKSLTMAFYAGRIIREPAMENPTLVVLTDRNDLDDQLFGTFSRCADLLRQPPVQAESRAHLRELLRVAAGGVVFTTIHKFFPETQGDRHPVLSERRNVVVIADEAHRSQYDFVDGFASHMRDALRMPPSSASQARPSSWPTRTRARSSATTSASTTSSAPCRTPPQCRSTTRAAWQRWASTRPSARRSTPSSKKSPKAKRSSARRSSSRSGLSSRRSSAPRSGFSCSRRASSTISRRGSRRWTARA